MLGIQPDFIQHLGENGFYHDNKRNINALSSIAGGAAGSFWAGGLYFEYNDKKPYYIAYISKKHDFSILSTTFPKENKDEISLKQKFTFTQYQQNYHDIVISVGCRFDSLQHTDCYEARGIFKNPEYIIEKNTNMFQLFYMGL